MKITCPSCDAKYSIADEKVQGKVAKIRCKKCGATIVVGGDNAHSGVAAAPAAASNTSYSVSVTDSDQRSMTIPEIVEAYNAGTINGETYVWADGMDDWAALANVPEIVGALGGDAGGAASEPPAPAAEPAPVVAAAPAAARRDSSRKGVDLFGAAAPAELDVVASPAMAMPSGPVGGAAAGLTGERNEQSVLFSLNALQKAADAKPSGGASSGSFGGGSSSDNKKMGDDSGLIDLGALAKQAETSAPALGGPSLLGAPVLGAPMLGGPSLDMAPTAASAAPPPPAKSKTGLIIGLAVAFSAVVIAGAIVATRGPAPAAQPAPTTAPAPTQTATEAAPQPTTTSTAVDPTQAASAAAPTAGKPAAGGPVKPGGPAPKPGDKPAAGKDPPAAAPAAPAAPPKAAGSPCGCAPGDLMCNMQCSTKKK